MMLLGLRVDKNPLIVEFMWSPDKKREEDSCYQEPYNNLYFDIKDQDKISKIMDYFIRKCDTNKSPQSLFQIKGVDYQTLIKDFKENSDFDEVLDYVAKILVLFLTSKDRSYIKGINVSYPETWDVIAQ